MAPSNRQTELEKMAWMELREIARKYGIEKPEGQGWEATIPMILEYEEKRIEIGENPPTQIPSLKLSQAQENVQAESIKTAKIAAKNTPEISSLDSTQQPSATANDSGAGTNPYQFETTIQKRGATTCPKCGDKIHRDSTGKPICSIGDPQCPILQN